MEVNDKVRELEEELKLLKAEIRNVLLDIREVVLERRNPLGEEHESAFIRMDLNTTARAMAAEAAAHEAAKASDAGGGHEQSTPAPAAEAQPSAEAAPAENDAPVASAEMPVEPRPEEATDAGEPAPSDVSPPPQEREQAPAPEPRSSMRAAAVREEEPGLDDTEIPRMYMADLAPLSGNGSLAEWVTEAIDTVGVEDLRRVITMFRLWGNVPPNISRALAYLQELLATTDEPRPSWLRVLQDLDRLASL